MTTERIDPLGIFAGTAGGTQVTSRLEINNTNHCPIKDCGKAMKPIMAAGIPSNICWDHRVVLPQPDLDGEPAAPATETPAM